MKTYVTILYFMIATSVLLTVATNAAGVKSNLLNGVYLFYKCCEKINCDDVLKCFPLPPKKGVKQCHCIE